MRITSAKPSSRLSPGHCVRLWNSIRVPPASFLPRRGRSEPPGRPKATAAALLRGGSSMTKNTVAVVDYGMGNLRSVSQAVQHAADQVGVEVFVTSDPDVVRRATRVVLPGQGAMPDCMRELRDSGLLESVLEAPAGKPLFGVCVGMQMLLSRSDEGPTDGLGLI